MAITKLAQEGRSEDPFELGGIECSGILSCSLEGVQGGIEIAGLAGHRRSRRLMGRGRPREHLDLLYNFG